MSYVILPPIHLGSGQLGEARKRVLEELAAADGCFWNEQPSVGRWIIKLADGERKMMAYYCSGSSGSVLQLEDGRYADTVGGDTSEPEEAHEAFDRLMNEAEGADWQASPILGDFSQEEMEDYCGVS